MTLVLSEDDVAAVADVTTMMAASRIALRASATGRAEVPLRLKMPLGSAGNRFIAMPGYLPDEAALVTKVVTICPGNIEQGRPLVGGVAVLTDPADGSILAVMSAATLTDVRTAATSAVAAEVLGRTDSRVLAVVGAGRLGVAHARALAHVYPLGEVRIAARSLASAERAVEELASDLAATFVATTPEEAVRGADLVVVATTSATPVLESSWLASGVHICAVGSASPEHREVDSDTVARAAVVTTDTVIGARAEAGDLIVPIAEGRFDPARLLEIGAVLVDPANGRRSAEEVTLFKGVGAAAVDAAAAAAIYRRARERGVGTEVQLS